MRYRLSMILPAVALGICLAFVPACKKKDAGGDGGGGEPAASPPAGPPANASSDYVMFVRLDAKSVRESKIFTELKDAFTKAGGTQAEWDQIDGGPVKEIGARLTEIDSVTVVVTDVPAPRRGPPPKGQPAPSDEPKFVLIMACSAPINKSALIPKTWKPKGGPESVQPDSGGFYKRPYGEELVHFPDDKTFVVLHSSLRDKYLAGYAKDRTGWPLTADLTKAAAGHTAFATVQFDKLPAELRNDDKLKKEFGDLLAVKAVTLTADLKGKELRLGARGTFPDAAAAGRAKDLVQKYVGMALGEVDRYMNGPDGKSDSFGLMPAIKAAHTALKDVKVDVSGSDVTLAGSYKADFDIAQMAANAVKKIREAAVRMKAQNNLKQIGIALHSIHDAQGRAPVHGVGPNAALLKNATEKPLLSWRVAILPYIEQGELYKQFKLNEPWDSEHNKKLIDKMPKIFASEVKPGKPGYTHLQMVVGPRVMQPPSASLVNITDGTSNTIAVIEAADPVVWTKPDDVMVPGNEAPKDFKKKFGGQFPGGMNALYWDGSVRFLRDTISDQTLWYMLTPNGGEAVPFGD